MVIKTSGEPLVLCDECEKRKKSFGILILTKKDGKLYCDHRKESQ